MAGIKRYNLPVSLPDVQTQRVRAGDGVGKDSNRKEWEYLGGRTPGWKSEWTFLLRADPLAEPAEDAVDTCPQKDPAP